MMMSSTSGNIEASATQDGVEAAAKADKPATNLAEETALQVLQNKRQDAHQVLMKILSDGGLKTDNLPKTQIPRKEQPVLEETPAVAADVAADAADGGPAPGTLLQADFRGRDPRGRKARLAPSATAGLMDLPLPHFARRKRDHDLSPSSSDQDYSVDSEDYSDSDPDDSWFAYGWEDPWEKPPKKTAQPLITPTQLPVFAPITPSLAMAATPKASQPPVQPLPQGTQAVLPSFSAAVAGTSSQAASAALTQESPQASATVAAPAAAGTQAPVHPLLQSLVVQPEEETGPAVEDSLASCIDDFWTRAIQDPDSLNLKECYDALLRPANLLNLVRTEVNPEMKNLLPRPVTMRDTAQKSVQNILLKAAYGSAMILHSIMTCPDLNAQATWQTLVAVGANVLKCLAFGNAKVNTNRRLAIKPQLSKKYRHLCDLKQAAHSFLLGADLTKSVKDLTEASKLSSHLAVQRRRRQGQGRRSHRHSGYRQQYRGNSFLANQKGGEAYLHKLGHLSKVSKPARPFSFAGTVGKPHKASRPANRGTSTPKQVSNSTRPSPGRQSSVQSSHLVPSSTTKCFSNATSAVNKNTMCLLSSIFRQTERATAGPTIQSGSPAATSSRAAEEARQARRQLDAPSLSSQVNISVDQIDLNQTPFICGGVSHKIHEWEKLTHSPEILQAVRGVALNFSDPPVQSKMPHQIKFTAVQQPLVRQELDKFLDLGIIETTTIEQGDFVSNLFTREKRTPGQIRCILNMKPLNKFIWYTHFKVEDLHLALQILRPNYYMAKIDLKHGFYNFKIRPCDRRFLKFLALGESYQFVGMPMGYADAPRQFTKCLRVPLSFLREKYGMLIIAFFDDLLFLADSPQKLLWHLKLATDLLQLLGFAINAEKSEIDPVLLIEFLGFILDSLRMSIKLTQARAQELRDLGLSILRKHFCPIRLFASFLGKCTAAFPAVRYGKLHTKELEMAKTRALAANAGNFDAKFVISDWEKLQIHWWVDNIMDQEFFLTPRPIQSDWYSDASTLGWGIYNPATGQKGGEVVSSGSRATH